MVEKDKPAVTKSVFQTDSRAKGNERRKQDEDRRGDIRMQEPRRSKARRPKGAWDDVKR
jgi:hypothetical protein